MRFVVNLRARHAGYGNRGRFRCMRATGRAGFGIRLTVKLLTGIAVSRPAGFTAIHRHALAITATTSTAAATTTTAATIFALATVLWCAFTGWQTGLAVLLHTCGGIAAGWHGGK